ncbi:hypothetical protein EG68_07724 [Paragonimus skrjabini miyazakii]|uniref:Uncharacterized protein n=1 Tax=Paragonimus skrjabini miyazakii TaxID=59628 RepID=A0A8S9YJA1_9TREM|nr:hypothetical protein EG68_07724 [Paragonimus skrjabini miyazakii]
MLRLGIILTYQFVGRQLFDLVQKSLPNPISWQGPVRDKQ